MFKLHNSNLLADSVEVFFDASFICAFVIVSMMPLKMKLEMDAGSENYSILPSNNTGEQIKSAL